MQKVHGRRDVPHVAPTEAMSSEFRMQNTDAVNRIERNDSV
jgi:hypothetical protein